MSLSEAFAPAEKMYRDQVISATWGHLAPQPYTKYSLSARLCSGAFGDAIILSYQVRLPDSPWLAQALGDLLYETEMEPGGVYEFTGKFWTNKDCSHNQFVGSVTKIL